MNLIDTTPETFVLYGRLAARVIFFIVFVIYARQKLEGNYTSSPPGNPNLRSFWYASAWFALDAMMQSIVKPTLTFVAPFFTQG